LSVVHEGQAIAARGLRKDFGSKRAVSDLTLDVGRGQVFGFLGPNGAGKTTAVKMLLGLVRPTRGHATVLGARIGDVAARARIGFLPEHLRFHEWLTGREFLRFHARLSGVSRRIADDRLEALLKRVGLASDAERRLRDYSKGMIQRAGLAQALVHDPELVFLDEPTSGLDPLGRLLVRDLIRELREHGKTIFLNSHLLSEVEITCDRVAFLREGRIVGEHDLAREGRLEVAMRLDRHGPALLDGLAAFGADPRRDGDEIVIDVEDEKRLPEMTRWLASQGVGFYSLGARRRSLERMFVEIMKEAEHD
jgi:ABC-2 type transport system ATP-binding protein